jgi:FMN phosphatase YigB (HAD superfamily)
MKGVRSEQTLLFDLDGTLLDQRFDNIFWNETVPRVIASQQDSSLEECKDKVYAYYKKVYGTLDWYSSVLPTKREVKLASMRALARFLIPLPSQGGSYF